MCGGITERTAYPKEQWHLSLCSILIGEREEQKSCLWASKWFLGKINGPLGEEIVGMKEEIIDMIVCVIFCLGVVPLFIFQKRRLQLVRGMEF